MRWMLALSVRLAVMARIAMLIGGCAKAPELLPMPATDMSMLEPAVRNRIAAAHAEFDAVAARKPSSVQLAKAYGELAMVYHAQDLATPAKIAYTNAHRLDPRDKRWPYLRSEEHTSELQSRPHLVCRLLLETKKITTH